VEYALRSQQVSKQLKAAVSAGASKALVLDSDSPANATLRDLSSGEETKVVTMEWLATQ